jgi:DNA polymerase III subunit alpha
MTAEFVHLHVHSQYSFLLSTVKLDALSRRVKELGMRAVALTDRANMYGAIRHYKYALSHEIQPILGCEINVVRDDDSAQVDHMVLLASTTEGYHNLVRVVSMGHLEPKSDCLPAVTLGDIAKYSNGVVGLTGCLGGVLPQYILENGAERAPEFLGKLAELFSPGHLFVELQEHALPEQSAVNDIMIRVAKQLDLPVVATNDVHFANQDDGNAQLYLECIRQGRTYAEAKPFHHGSFEMYLKSAEQMAQTFRDVPEALSNTLRVAEMCRDVKLELGKPMLPHFPIPEGYDTETYFRHVTEEGLKRRFAEFAALGRSVDNQSYYDRLELELGVIVGMKFPGYFLIVWDFIREAKHRGVPVGPGRGSGAGSLVAFALGITEIDPIPHALLFERFLNPERVSMPDFDVDFCMDRRGEVIDYVTHKYGERSVGQIATFQNLKARSVIKDVARSMGFAAQDAQRLATLVPEKGQGKMCTIAEALEIEPKLKREVEADPRVAELLAQAQKLEGLTRHAGMHAAGVVISEGPLYNHVPCFMSDQTIVTQYDKDDVEAAGLVKFDFLGLKTLTVIDCACRLVNARPDRRQRPLVLSEVALDDRDTYQLITSGETTGVFQLESSGMQQMLRQLKPDRFEDIVAAVALYRPGPLGGGMVERFIRCKHGRESVRTLHPLIDDVLAPTYGVIVYQEQVMQIAQKLSGYTLGRADLLRRAMGKKKAEEMKKQKDAFIDGAVARGVAKEQADSIFDEVEKFAAYGFNKSHSAAYALVTYQTAYLKTHYPTEFFAATMTTDNEKIEKVVRTIAEARAWGVSVLPPDVNASLLDFAVVYDHPEGQGPARGPGKLKDRYAPRIRFGLGAVRGLGESALEGVFAAREQGGPFGDLFDFAARVDSKRLNKGVLEALVQCGAFDTVSRQIGVTRARTYGAVDRALERSRSATRDRERGQTSLFGLLSSAPSAAGNRGQELEDYSAAVVEWDRSELLRREKEALGCYVTGHPLARYGRRLSRLGVTPTSQLSSLEIWSVVTVAGMVEDYQEKLFKSGGGKAAFFVLEDQFGRVRAKLKEDRIEHYSEMLRRGDAMLVAGKVSFPPTEDEEAEREATLLVDSAEPLAIAAQKAARALGIRLPAERISRDDLKALAEILEQSPGECNIELNLSFEDGAEAQLLVDKRRVNPNDELMSALERRFGYDSVELL